LTILDKERRGRKGLRGYQPLHTAIPYRSHDLAFRVVTLTVRKCWTASHVTGLEVDSLHPRMN
jgi:hypothetical protein